VGYKVKWVEENLGVSRKALRNFEKHGLMPANEGGGYRDYSDEDIERIWAIRLFQGMGYTLKELVKLSESDDFDFGASLEKKIQELENEKVKIERHLGYAQHIKLTGRFPSRPKNMGTITFEEFQEKALNQWNVNSDPKAKKYQEIADLILNTPEDELKDTDIGRLFEFLIELQEQMSDMDSLFIEKVIPNEIIKRIENGPEDEEVQLLVKMMYENRISSISDMAKSQFVRFESSSYISGDIARMHEKEYGKDGCRFIADAIAVFGGYSCYDEVED
jgi:transcriptional regulator, merR family